MRRDPTRYRSIPAKAVRIELPNVFQLEGYTCGAAAVLSICSYYGVGPEEEWDVARDMRMRTAGTDPVDVVAAVEKYGLAYEQYRPMTDAQLRACIDRRRPVMLMLQAWADRRPKSYRTKWHDGHWVIAIGFSRTHLFVEDPSIYSARGYLTWRELADRWHDIEGAHEHHVERYGIAIWKPGATRSAFATKARHVD